MNTALMKLLEQHGDVSFPHAPATAEELLLLFRGGEVTADAIADRLLALVRADPGFAFNLARLFREEGMALGATLHPDLRSSIGRFNAFRIVSILGPKETWSEVFGSRRLAAAYAELAALTVRASKDAIGAARPVTESQELALLMTFQSGLGLLGLANLLQAAALPVLEAGAGADEICQATFGFSVAEFSRGLNERYAMPDVADVAYPAAVRELVRRSWASAISAGAAGSRTRPETAIR